MATAKNITPGKVFGRLTFVGFDEADASNFPSRRLAYFLCECGKTHKARMHHVKEGSTTSCGCYQKESVADRSWKHGNAARGEHSIEYSVWRAIISRCHNPKATGYSEYGGRGISVCDRWRKSFEHFLADMGQRSSIKNSIDRFPNMNGNYEPGNCRWATAREQAMNRRSTRFIEIDGRTLCLSDWSKEAGISVQLLHIRIAQGWPKERWLEPAKSQKK